MSSTICRAQRKNEKRKSGARVNSAFLAGVPSTPNLMHLSREQMRVT